MPSLRGVFAEVKGSSNDAVYTLHMIPSPLPKDDPLKQQILNILSGFGPHFSQWFGRDLQIRLEVDAGVTTFIAVTPKGDIAAHSSVYVDPENPTVGALFNVFTGLNHRKQGLSRKLVEATCKFFDEIGGQLMVLGTGSPFAART